MTGGLRHGRVACRPAVLVLLLVLTGGCEREAPAPEVDRHRADIGVEPDGTLTVTEQFQVRVTAEEQRFDRRVESERSDGVTLVAATLDGRDLVDGRTADPALQVLEQGEALHVRWTLPPVGRGGQADEFHTLGLRYRVAAAVEVLPVRGRIVWPVLPHDRRFRVAGSTVVLVVPETAQWLPGTGMAEAGWTVERADRGILATRSDVGFESGTLLAELTIDRQAIALPEWQVTEDLRSEFSLAFVAGGLFVLVIGAGVLWLVAFQYRVSPDRRASGPEPLDRPLAPAAAAALARPQRAGPEATRELIARGLLDAERLSIAQGLRTTAWAGGLLGIACAIVAQFTLSRFGWWAQIIPLSLLLMAVTFLIAGRRFRVLTEKGARARNL